MTSKERIKKCLNFEQPDRIGTYDVFLKETIDKWKTQGFSSDLKPEGYFGHDFETVLLDEPKLDNTDKNKFISIAVTEPFGETCKELTFEEALKKLVYEPRSIKSLFNKITKNTLKKISSFIENFHELDGVWLSGDLAYDNGLLFSLNSYKKMLLPLHKELCSFFKSKNLYIIFHSHGDVRGILPSLIDLGVRAVEPLETSAGLDIFELRREYKKDLVLFGNIEFDKLKSSRDTFKDEVEKKIGFLKKEGGYIYRMDKDITPDIEFNDYKFAVELVKQYGDYKCR